MSGVRKVGCPSARTSCNREGSTAPEGYELSEVRGSAGGSENGWTFVVDETIPKRF